MFETRGVQRVERNGAARPPVLSVQALRFVAAFSVALFHAQLALSKQMHETLAYWFGLGAAGVHIFFCISGFVIMHTSYGADGRGIPVGRFLLKRFVRIFPIYWICCMLYVAFHQTWGTGYQLSAAEWVTGLLLLPPDSAGIIGPGWTLSFELYFYLCFALLLWLAPLPALLILTMFFGASVAVGFVLPFDEPIETATSPLILEFIAGAWLGYFYIRRHNQSSLLGLILAGLGLILFILANALFDHRTAPLTLIWGLPSVLIVAGVLMFEQARPLPQFLQKVSHLGDSSYVLYLIHILCIAIALRLGLKALVPLGPIQSVATAFVLAALVTIIAALIFEHIEKPMLRWLRRNLVDRYSSGRPGVSPEKSTA